MKGSRLAGGVNAPLWVGALGVLALLLVRPTRDLVPALALLDGAMSAVFLASGLVIGRRTTRVFGPLLLSVGLVFALREVALVGLKLASPSLSLPLLGWGASLGWIGASSALGALGAVLGAREGVSTVFLYEARLSLRAPSTWIALSGFLFLAGTAFVAHMNEALLVPGRFGEGLGAQILIPTAQEQGGLLLYASPLLALRLAGRGTHRALPVSSASLVLGRFGASLVPLWLGVVVAAWLPLLLVGEARVPLLGAAVAALGLGLVACSVAALGVFFASLSRKPSAAGALGLFFALGVQVAHAHLSNAQTTLTRLFLGALSLPSALDPFARGVLDSRAVAHLSSVTLLGLFLAVRVEEARRWL